MAVLRFREAAAAEDASNSAVFGAIDSGRVSAEVIEDRPNASLPQLQPPGAIAINEVAMKLAVANAAISDIEELLGKVRASHDELHQTLDDLRRDRDEWRRRAERLTERPWWRRLAG